MINWGLLIGLTIAAVVLAWISDVAEKLMRKD